MKKVIPEEIRKRYDLDFNDQFIEAYDRLENTADNLFLTGKAGTGKSTLLRCFRENTMKNLVVLAPTGVAAVNVRGQTIHSFFRFKPDITPDFVEHIKMRKAQRQLYERLETIVIDEISMVRADLLDCIDRFLRMFGKYKGEPFGGVQMIFFGDLYQLPPVVTSRDRQLFEGVYASPYFFDAKSYPDLDLKFIEFETIYRQKQENFIRLLAAIRDKNVEEEHILKLNERVDPSFSPRENDFYIYLTTTNALADRINKQRLASLQDRPYTFEGKIDGGFDEKYLPTHKDLELKWGAQVMLLNNDPQGRWINGSIGKIIFAEETSKVVEIQLSDGRKVDVTPFTWEMYKFAFNEQTARIEAESVGSYTQYPLRLAWAVTIHKSQGQTFDKVIVDIGSGTFAHGQMYVALSRCTRFEGLVLRRPVYPRHILLDQRVVDYMHGALRAQK